MTNLIPISRRLAFRGALGLGVASFAAPAIIRPRTVPDDMVELANFLDLRNPGVGRTMVEHAHRQGLRFDQVDCIIFQGGDVQVLQWPRVLFSDRSPGGMTWTVAPAFMSEHDKRHPTIRFANG